jgi:SurA N-terminal domain
MSRRFLLVTVTMLASLIALPAWAGDVIDRIVATVNGHIILLSDWEDALYYQALEDGRPVDQQDRKAALDHLIDQELLREQMNNSNFRHATPEEVNQRVQEIRKQYAEAGTEEGWHSLLARYRTTEDQLKQRLTLQLDLLHLVDARLRPNVNVDPKSIESYYNQELLPQLRQAGAKDVSLAEVSPKIKEVLTQQKVNELLVAWLQDLRAGSEIRKESSGLDSEGQPQ